MADWPAGGGGRIETVGAISAGGSSGTGVTTGFAANTKGDWVELSAVTPVAASSLLIIGNFAGGSWLLDIGIGAAGSEQAIIPNILRASADLIPTSFLFPVHIPAGVRLVGRAACTASPDSVSTIAYLLAEGFTGNVGRNRVLAYGVDTSDSGGTSIDPGATENTKGAWTQVTAATTAPHHGLALAVGNQANIAATGGSWLFDIAVGASGSELIIVADYRVSTSVAETVSPPFSPFLPVNIPAGSRLVVRSQSTVINATDRVLDAVLYGVL